MKILLIRGKNQYGVVSHFFTGIASDLIALSLDVYQLSLEDEQQAKDSMAQMGSLNDYDMVISFNGVGLNLNYGGTNITQYTRNKPVYILAVDHPIHIMKRFWGFDVTLLCVDKDHVKFCQLCGVNAIYFPHAVALSKSEDLPLCPVDEKTDEILFPVSFFSVKEYRDKLEPVWQQLGVLIDRCNSVNGFLKGIGVIPTESQPATLSFDENIRRICLWVDRYIRAKKRIECLRHFQEQEIKLTVIGRNSEQYRQSVPLHNYLPAVEYNELQQKIAKSQFIVHNSPGFESGLHERIVEPLMLGTLVVAFDTPFIQKELKSGVLDSVTSIEKCNESYEQERSRARAEVLEKHSWQTRFESLIQSAS